MAEQLTLATSGTLRLWFLLKSAFFVGLFILLRAALPRPRYDQLMAYGWKVMLPLALLNLVVTGAVLLIA